MQEYNRKPLEAGYLVGGYSIVRVIGQGGFGIVYEAQNNTTRERVAIKQFYPNALTSWKYGTIVVNRADDKALVDKILKRFHEEAGLQFNFNHPNILKVKNFISADNTGYMITEYIDGQTLVEFLKPHGSIFPTEDMFRRIMEPILDAVKYVHQRETLHRDISPDNIMIDSFGKPILVDFGAAKLDLRKGPSPSSVVAYREEYAPVEQQEPAIERPEGFYTDIFALAGTMYRLLSGKPPVRAITRSLASKDPYVPISQVSKVKCSEAVFEAIDRGLALPPTSRPAAIENFLKLLGWHVAALPEPAPAPPPLPPPPRAIWPRYLAVLVLIAVVAGALMYVSRPEDLPVAPSSRSPTAAPIAANTPTPSPTASAASPRAEVHPTSPSPSPSSDPRSVREQRLYDEALACIRYQTSCNTTACLTPYSSGIGYLDRYDALREESERVLRSTRCAPPPAPIASPPTPDPRIAKEKTLYEAAFACLHNSCDIDGCLTQYRSSIGDADRYPSLREEYEKVRRSPRCAPPPPPPPPRVSYHTFENRDLDGGDLPGKLPHLTGVDQQACSSACDAAKDCIGFSYGKWDRACYLKQSLPDLRFEPNSTAVIRSDQKIPPDFKGERTIEKAQRTFAGNRYSASPASSRKACSNICDSEAQCLGYQFVAGACWRYERIDFATKDPTAQSGVKRQTAPQTSSSN